MFTTPISEFLPHQFLHFTTPISSLYHTVSRNFYHTANVHSLYHTPNLCTPQRFLILCFFNHHTAIFPATGRLPVDPPGVTELIPNS